MTHHRSSGFPLRLLSWIVEPSVNRSGMSGATSPTLSLDAVGVDAGEEEVEPIRLYDAKVIRRIVTTTRPFRFQCDSP